MKLLLMDLSAKFEDFLIKKSILYGVEIYSARNDEKVLELIKEKNITHLIINIDSKFYDFADTLTKIQNLKLDYNLYVIAQTRRLYKNNLATLLEKGVAGILPLTGDIEEMYEKLRGLLEEKGYFPNKRRYFRVSFDDDAHQALIKFPVPNYEKMISGRINDLSIFALAFKLDNSDEYELLREKEILENVQVILDEKRIFTEIIISKKRDSLLVGRFSQPQKNENFTTFICNYIFKKLEDDFSNTHLVDI